MDGTLSNSQLDEDKEEQIKLENLVTEETKGFAPIDHWKKMLSMKTEEVCTINIGSETSNMSAGKPTVGELMVASLSIYVVALSAVYGALFSPKFTVSHCGAFL